MPCPEQSETGITGGNSSWRMNRHVSPLAAPRGKEGHARRIIRAAHRTDKFRATVGKIILTTPSFVSVKERLRERGVVGLHRKSPETTIQVVGSGTTFRFSNNPVAFTWTDGTPSARERTSDGVAEA